MNLEHLDPLIIGVGNEWRHDDGVGLIVARQLQAQAPVGVLIIEQSGEGASLPEAWKGHMTVLLVDAVDSSAPPGTIHRVDAHAEPLARRLFRGSTHAFSVAEAIELARALNELPPRLLLYGIEGEDFSAGIGLSAEVEQGIAEVIARILGDLRSLAGFGCLQGVESP